MNTRVLVAVAALAAAAWAFKRWRQAVPAVMVLLVLEGAIRKWFFPGAQDVVYFAKDLLLLGIYGGFLSESARIKLRAPKVPPLFAALAAGTVLGLFEIFNPKLPSLLVGVLGWKAYFFYVPLYWIVPAALPSDGRLYRFLRRYALFAVPVGLLAAAQFFAPPSSPLNTYARSGGETSDIVTFGSSTHVRVTGTFAFISGYTSYLFATIMLALALLATAGWRLRGNLFQYAALFLSVLGLLMSGSRGPVILIVALLPLYWWLAVLRQKGGVLAGGRLVLGFALIGSLVAYAGADAFGAWLGRASGSSDVAGRLLTPFLQPIYTIERAGLLGYGIGATHQMATAVVSGVRPYSWLEGPQIEDETGRVMLELGPIGFAVIYFVRIYLIVYAFRATLRMRSPFHRSFGTAALLFFLAQLPGGVIFEVTAGVYYWFFAGLLAAAVALDREPAKSAAPRPVAISALKASRARQLGAGWVPPAASVAGPAGEPESS